MSVDQEKRMAGDYVIIHALHIGDREIVLGENPAVVGDERYMCAFCQSNGLRANYTEVMVSDDYPELAKLFGERVAEQAEKTRIDLNGPKIQGIHNTPITAEGCEVIGHQHDLRGKIVVTRLYSGKTSRFERSDILGVIAPENLPKWAKHYLECIQQERQAEKKARDREGR